MPSDDTNDPPVRPSHRISRRRAIAIVGAASVAPIAFGKHGSADESDGRRALQPNDATAVASPEPTFWADQLPEILTALAEAGISVYESAGDSESIVHVPDPGPVALLMSQLRSMVLELVSGGGIIGADLDALVSDRPLLGQGDSSDLFPQTIPLEVDGHLVIPPSLLVASYIQTVDSPGAEVIRKYRPEIVVEHGASQVIPMLAMTLFSAEIAREHSQRVGGTGGGVRALVPPAVQGGICSQATSFIDNMLNQLFAALKLDLGPSLPGQILGSIINGAILGFRLPIKAAIDSLLKPVLDIVRDIAGVLAVAATVVSTVRPWTLRFRAEPPASRLAIGAELGLPGKVTVQVDLGGFDEWPVDVADCAAASGVPLPSLKPENARCSWAVTGSRANLVQTEDLPAKLDKNAKAVLTYHTLSESEEVAKGDPVNGIVIVTARIARPEIDNLKQTLANLLFAQLPKLLEQFVRPYLGPIVDDLLGKIGSLTDSQGQATFVVVYHEPPKKTPTPEPEEDDSAGGSIDVTMEPTFPTSASGVTMSGSIGLSASSCDGEAWTGSASMMFHVDSEGFTGDAEGTAPLSWDFQGSDQAATMVGPFAGTIEVPNLASSPLSYTLELSITRTQIPESEAVALTFDVILHSTFFGSSNAVQLEGFSNLRTPIPVVAGAVNCEA